ncbi:AraC family transcriptional regulator [Povalibacter sp.]|uniref:AraC family transcriptional regulator n=1 Tax=Povalibacter sp. TaxID=1962978 RepID=UPI002F42E18F
MIVRRTQELQSSVSSARAGHDGSVILNLNTQAADYALDGRRLALLSAWNGNEEVALDGRRVIVDDDTWLLASGGPTSVRIRTSHNVHSLTILFRQGMPEEVLGALTTSDDHMLEDGEAMSGVQLPFTPHLRTHDRSVTPVLLFIRRHCEMGLDDALWYEEQLAFLLERLLINHRHLLTRARQIPVRRASTRREILRRVSLATDFIHSSFAKPLMLSDMAGAAFLSRHHFLRLFKQIHDVTPHEYLQRKRTSVAARLLRSSQRQVDEVVKEVGFDSRSTLFRALRRFHGLTPRECRHVAEAPVFMGHMIASAAGGAWVSTDEATSRTAVAQH